jgi:hypothetical protein
MRRSVYGLLFGLIAGVGLVGAATTADAGYRHGNCCGPLPTTYTYGTVNRVSHVTHVHDVYRQHYFDRPKLYVHITRIHPIVYVHDLTRIHDRAIPVVRPVHEAETQYEATTTIVTSSVVHIKEGCCCQQ